MIKEKTLYIYFFYFILFLKVNYFIGLGTQRIHGRINLALLTIEDVVFLASFAIVNTDHVEIIIGLDNLKKHKVCINMIFQLSTF